VQAAATASTASRAGRRRLTRATPTGARELAAAAAHRGRARRGSELVTVSCRGLAWQRPRAGRLRPWLATVPARGFFPCTRVHWEEEEAEGFF